MKTGSIFPRTLAALFVCAAMQLPAQAGTPTIKPVTSFGPFPYGPNTLPRSINNKGDIAGDLEDQDHKTEGFARFHNGTHLEINPPNSQLGRTTVRGINDSGLIAGNYFSTEPEKLSFFLSGDTYTDVMLPGARSFTVTGLNNAGDFCGLADFGGSEKPYISIGGNVTVFPIPGIRPPFFIYVAGMNNLDQVVGDYTDPTGLHGFLRNADNTITYPIDYPGGAYTNLYGINDKGWMVGSYTETEGSTHGLFLSSPTDFVAFDFPRATYTVLTGINNRGLICGLYVVDFGVTYGAVARVVHSSDE